MATTTPNVAQMQTEARSRQMADELAAAASIAQPPASKTVFPADNDAALQALINESKEKSLEYQRLQNEEDRQQWERKRQRICGGSRGWMSNAKIDGHSTRRRIR